MWPFIKSVLMGSGAAALIPTVVLAYFAITGWRDVETMSLLLEAFAFTILFALAVTLVASILFGLPLTAFLRHRDRESAGTYIIAGAALGIAIPTAFAALPGIGGDAFALALFGAPGGLVTAWTWWRSARKPKLDC